MSKIMKDEYEEIYGQYEGSGFEFDYNKKHLSKSKLIHKHEINKIDSIKRNNDDIPLFVRCKACEDYMNFKLGRTGYLDGSWICQSCGIKVRERTIYNQLDRENNKFVREYEYEEEPGVCRDCGGPWPGCQSGCRLFRD